MKTKRKRLKVGQFVPVVISKIVIAKKTDYSKIKEITPEKPIKLMKSEMNGYREQVISENGFDKENVMVFLSFKIVPELCFRPKA